jgi:hypothetical protein
LLVWSVGWWELQIKVLDHCSSALSFWPCCAEVPAQTSEQNPIEPLAFLKRVTCSTTLVFKVRSTSVWIFGENSVWKGLNETLLNVGAPAHDVVRVSPRRPRRPGLRAHAEAPENPAVWGPRRWHCALEAVTLAWRPRPVPRGRCALADGRTAIPHWPSAPPHVAIVPRPCWSFCRPHRWSGTTLRAYKTSPSFSLARPRTHRPPPSAISAVGDTAAPLAAVLNRWPLALP